MSKTQTKKTKRWRRFLCWFLKHVPEEFEPTPGVEGIRCKRCGLEQELCAWCGKHVATMEARMGGEGPPIGVCRPCVGV